MTTCKKIFTSQKNRINNPMNKLYDKEHSKNKK